MLQTSTVNSYDIWKVYVYPIYLYVVQVYFSNTIHHVMISTLIHSGTVQTCSIHEASPFVQATPPSSQIALPPINETTPVLCRDVMLESGESSPVHKPKFWLQVASVDRTQSQVRDLPTPNLFLGIYFAQSLSSEI